MSFGRATETRFGAGGDGRAPARLARLLSVAICAVLSRAFASTVKLNGNIEGEGRCDRARERPPGNARAATSNAGNSSREAPHCEWMSGGLTPKGNKLNAQWQSGFERN